MFKIALFIVCLMQYQITLFAQNTENINQNKNESLGMHDSVSLNYILPEKITADLFISHANKSYGEELWVVIDTVKYLVKDINKGMFNSKPNQFFEYKNEVYFVANDLKHGDELWKTDGTEEGTVMVSDIMSGFGLGSDISNFTIFNDKLFFVATDWEHGKEIFVTDGTPEGTTIVKDIHKGKTGSFPNYLTIIQDNLYFVTDEWDSVKKLWKTDGTEDGTIEIGDFKKELANLATKEAKNLQLIMSLPKTDD